MEAPFVPSLLVETRKRMGQSVFDVFQSAIVDSVEEAKAKQKKASRKSRIRMITNHRQHQAVDRRIKSKNTKAG